MMNNTDPPILPEYKYQWYSYPFETERYGRGYIQDILKAGLLFLEDSIAVETMALEEAPDPPALLIGSYTLKEVLLAILGTGFVTILPYALPRSTSLSTVIGLSVASTFCMIPMGRQIINQTSHLQRLIVVLQRGTKLRLGTSRAFMCEALLRASNNLKQAFPWLDPDEWEMGESVQAALETKDPKKLYNLYLVLQSNFLRRVAFAHVIPLNKPQDINHRVRWLHSCLINNLIKSLSIPSLPLYKSPKSSNTTRTELPSACHKNWRFKSHQDDISLVTKYLMTAVNICSNVDSEMENLKVEDGDLNLLKYEKQVKGVKANVKLAMGAIENITSSLENIRNMGKEQKATFVHKINPEPKEVTIRCVSESTPINIEDEVYYCVSKLDPDPQNDYGDDPHGPGSHEMEAARALLDELRERLVKTEDVMRAREAAALEKTMPELKGNLPEFPRQMIKEDDKELLAQKKQTLQNEISNLGIESNGSQNNKATLDLLISQDAHEKDSQMDVGELNEDNIFVNTEETVEASGSKILKDLRKHRVTRRKNHPPSRHRSKKATTPSGTHSANENIINKCYQNGDTESEIMINPNNRSPSNHLQEKIEVQSSRNSSPDMNTCILKDHAQNFETVTEPNLFEKPFSLNDINIRTQSSFWKRAENESEVLMPNVGAGMAMANLLQGAGFRKLNEEIMQADGENTDSSENED